MDWTSKRAMASCLRVHPTYPISLTSPIPMGFKKSGTIEGCHQFSVCGRAEDRLLGPVGPQWILPNDTKKSSNNPRIIWQPGVTSSSILLFFFLSALWDSLSSQDGSITAIEVGVRSSERVRRRRGKQEVGWAAFSPHEEKLQPVHHFEPATASRPSPVNVHIHSSGTSTLRLAFLDARSQNIQKYFSQSFVRECKTLPRLLRPWLMNPLVS